MSTTPLAASPALIHLRPYRSNDPESANVWLGVIRPDSSAAEPLIALKVEPVGYPDWIARSSKGSSSAVLSALTTFVETGGVNTLGSNVGLEPMPRIEPSPTFIATNAPGRPVEAIADSPAAWTFLSRVSFRLSPASGSSRESSRPRGSPEASTWTRIAPLRPRRIWSYCNSRPVAPIRSPCSSPS